MVAAQLVTAQLLVRQAVCVPTKSPHDRLRVAARPLDVLPELLVKLDWSSYWLDCWLDLHEHGTERSSAVRYRWSTVL